MMFQISSLLALLSATAVAQHFSTPHPIKGQPINSIPQIGIGTARLVGNTSEVIANAIENGFRHIDCAFWYSNQKDVGLGIKEGLRRTGLSRTDIWVTGKLYNEKYGNSPLAQDNIVRNRCL
jgi:alcohol dehydrogenase (NADP+)